MKLKLFKEEFRLISTDTWGTAIEAWFECAAHLYLRDLPIPSEWEYRPSPIGNVTEEDSYFHNDFATATDEELLIIGNFLFRYCQYLRFKGIDY